MAIQRGYRWFFSSGNQFPHNVVIPFSAAGAPTDAVTGAGYFNSGTKASPVWTAFGSTAGAATPSSVVSSGLIKSTSPTAGIGYATGAGGAVTQASSRTTGVTLNTVVGAITLVSAAGSTTPASFTVTNSAVAATDVIVLNQKSGTDLLSLSVTAIGAGSFQITFNTKSGTTTEQPVINFAVLKGVTS